MWIADFKVWHFGSESIELSRDFDAALHNFNLNLYRKNGIFYIMRCAYFSGENAKEFRDTWIKGDKRIKVIASDGQQVFYSHPADVAFHTLLFDREIFFVGPVITEKGFQYWKVAAPKKKPLLSLFKRVQKLGPKKASIELLSLRQGDVNIFAQGVLSELTPLQLQALQLACKHGYYSYPRKISLQQLAKLVGIPRTTLQSHLRRAERTILPSLVEKTL